MRSVVEETERAIGEAVRGAASRAMGDGALPAVEDLPDFTIEIPAERAHGDYAVNAALVWAKVFRKPPRVIAEALISHLDYGDMPVEKAEAAGPGFVNFFLSGKFYSDVLSEVLREGPDYGKSDYGAGQKVMVEFVSANPTGPMHIGNARGGALGDCLAGVLQWAGYDVTREFYVNDAGNQIMKFGESLEARYLQIYDPSAPFPEDGYHGEDITERAKGFAEKYGDAYLTVSPEERRRALTDYALPLNIAGLKEDLAEYRINYDVWFRESSLYASGEVDALLDKMRSLGLTYEKDGALWYKATEHGGEKDEVLVRANGNPTYFAADIAYHVNKFQKRGFDRVINIWGADHHGHVARLKGALDAVGVDSSRLDIVLMQLVRVTSNGEVVKVSKRTGKSISLKTLLDEVPVDAARFIFNSKEPNTHLEFDLDLAVEQSSENPVYYVQYAHARICSILRQAGEDLASPAGEGYDLLSSPEERELIRHLSLLGGEIIAAAKSYDSARLTRYVYNLATLFHKFYNARRVLCDDPALRGARLDLCRASAVVIENVLGVLKIDAPQTM